MKKMAFPLAIIIALAAAPALAHQCPTMMAAIDEALLTADLSGEDEARVMELRERGEEEHDAGDHDASEASLGEAMGILGID